MRDANSDPRFIAADGAVISDGKQMFNYYDGEYVTVEIEGTSADPTSEFHQYWDGWFTTIGLSSGRRTPLNNERLAGKKPEWMR